MGGLNGRFDQVTEPEHPDHPAGGRLVGTAGGSEHHSRGGHEKRPPPYPHKQLG